MRSSVCIPKGRELLCDGVLDIGSSASGGPGLVQRPGCEEQLTDGSGDLHFARIDIAASTVDRGDPLALLPRSVPRFVGSGDQAGQGESVRFGQMSAGMHGLGVEGELAARGI